MQIFDNPTNARLNSKILKLYRLRLLPARKQSLENLSSLLLLFRHSAKSLNAQKERLATSP